MVRVHHCHEAVADDDDIAGLDGDVGPRADRDPHVGLHQRGRVVDAIAHHGHAVPLLLQAAHPRRLVLRQHLRMHLSNPDLAAHGPCGPLVITGDHRWLDSEPPQM